MPINRREFTYGLALSAGALSLNRFPSQQTVRVNGQRVNQPAWSYDGQTNSIIFRDQDVPARGSDITVDYDVVCLQ